jgi:sigma-B regulation protein RsbU (phosphoserine phosphatase)
LTKGAHVFYETHLAPLLRMQGAVREIALDIACADGRRLPVLVTSTVTLDRNGEPALARTTVFEATDRREYERELLRARQRAEESERRARELAETLQASLIPPALPRIPDLDVGGAYRPAGAGDEVGGDFYDVFETSRDRWSIVIGDVCGKGAGAAVVTALSRYTLRAAAMNVREPCRVLQILNDALLRDRSDRFCTASYVCAERTDGGYHLEVASAGHPLPIRVSANGMTEELGRPGNPLGLFDNPVLYDTRVDLVDGDVVALYTDGVTEARRDDDFFGEERLRSVLVANRDRDAATIAQRLADDAVEFQRGNPRDDIAAVVLKFV